MDALFLKYIAKEQIKKWVLVAGILLCGTVLTTSAIDQALTVRHIVWCVMTVILAICTTEIRVGRGHILMFGYLGCALITGFWALNKAEWLANVLRIILLVSYISVVRIDRRLLSKTMICLGLIFIVYFWYDFYRLRVFELCRGLMRQRNTWATAQFLVIPFCYHAITHKFWKKTAVFVALMMAFNIILLSSRCAMLALGLTVFIVLIRNNKARKYLIIASAVTVIAVLCFNARMILNTVSMHQRLAQWLPTLSMIKDYPLGTGPGNWQIHFPYYAPNIDYPLAYIKDSFEFPHNDFLWVWSEAGLIGIFCYLGMFIVAIKNSWNQTWLLAGLSGYIVIAFFSCPHARPFPSLILATFLAMSFPGKVFRIQQYAVVIVLLFVLVVFGYRHKANVWNKEIRKANNVDILQYAGGGSVFSSITYTGHPWDWWTGMANLALGRKEFAIEHLKRAYKYSPNNIYVLNSIGMACGMEGDVEQARIYFKEALRICPSFEEATLNMEILKGSKVLRVTNYVND